MEIGANNAVDHTRNRPTFITPSPDPMADDYGCRWGKYLQQIANAMIQLTYQQSADSREA
jgi:hypothetical protein